VNHPLIWHGSAFRPTGYADELRGMVIALERAGIPVILRDNPAERLPSFADTLVSSDAAMLQRAISRSNPGTPFVQVQHAPLDTFGPSNSSAYAVGRSMFETDGLPAQWVARANTLDELWVPSAFNAETFRRSGVTVPTYVIGGGIDSDVFHPGVAPMPIVGTRGTVFLSVFEWRLRKGWDVLLRAWANAFRPDDDVTLVLRTYPMWQVDGVNNSDAIASRIDGFLRESCDGRTRADIAPIVVLGDQIPANSMASLYTAANAFVLPTRGEGWGRPFMEAMACGVPVIATNWSAHLEFMNSRNSYLTNVDALVVADSIEVPQYAGQQWASPSCTHLTDQLQRVHRDTSEARAIGAIARDDMVQHWPWSRTASLISNRLQEIDGRVASRVVERATATREIQHAESLGDIIPFVLSEPCATVVLFHPQWSSDNTMKTLRTFAEAFGADDDVTLVVCLDPEQGVSAEDATARVQTACASAGRSAEMAPDILLVPDALTELTLHQLRAACSVVLAINDREAGARALRAGRAVFDTLDARMWRDVLVPQSSQTSISVTPEPQKFRVAVCALFRNSARYVNYFRAVLSAQERENIELVFSLVEGDSTDETPSLLQQWAADDPRVILTTHNVEPVADHDDRVRKWAQLGNVAVEATLTRDCTHILWCESDLALPLDLLEQLVSAERDIVAPAIFLGGMFYDTWGFRGTDGVRFTNTAPYHKQFQPHALVELNSVGSCVLFKRDIFDAGVRFRGEYENGLLVGVCRDAAMHGFRTFMDSRVSVLHPTTLWQKQQYRLAVVTVTNTNSTHLAALQAAATQIANETRITLGAVDLPADHAVFAPVHRIISTHLRGASYALTVHLASETRKQYRLELSDVATSAAA
jgi:glycosyltransferase involved in cell wall biosynthesis